MNQHIVKLELVFFYEESRKVENIVRDQDKVIELIVQHSESNKVQVTRSLPIVTFSKKRNIILPIDGRLT